MGSAQVYYDKSISRQTRLVYRKIWMRPPALNADIQSSSESVNAIVDQEFELLGSGAVSTDATIDVDGGTQIASHGAGTSTSYIAPHLDASQSAWATTLWKTSKAPHFETAIVAAPAGTVASMILFAGFKLTGTSVVATDDDQAYFRYEAGSNSGKWTFVYSIANTDVTVVCPVDVCAAVAALGFYILRIEFDADRRVQAFINGRAIMPQKTPAMTSLSTLIPYVGVLEATGTAKKFTCKYLEAGRDY